MAGINIDIGANTRDFQRATTDVERALDDVADALDDVARDTARSAEQAGRALSDGIEDGTRDAARATDRLGDNIDDSLRDAARASERLGDDIGDNVQDGTRDAERSTERLERSFRELSDAADASTRGAGDSIGGNVRRGTDNAREGLREVGEEAQGTAREAAASFDGSASSIGDAFQEVTANAFAGFGPAGVAAGAAAAVGLGVIFTQIEKNEERTQALKEKTAQLAQEYIDTGAVGEASLEYMVDQLKELATNTEEGATTLADLRKAADTAGSSYEDLAKAYSGNVDGIDDLISASEEYLKSLSTQVTAEVGSAEYQASAIGQKVDATKSYIQYLRESQTAATDAAAQQDNYAKAGGPELAAKAEAAGDYADAVQDAYAKAGSAIDDYVTDGVFNLEKYTEESQKQADAVAAYQQNMVTLSQTLSDEALDYIASLGPDAAPLIDAFVKAPLGQQQATAEVWSKLGQTSTDAFGVKVQKNLNGANFQSTVVLNPNEQKIRDYLNVVKTQDVLLRVKNRIDLPANQGMGVP